MNRIGSIERLAQQVAMVEDSALAADYARVHGSFKQVAAELMQLPLDDAQRAALVKTVAQEQDLYEQLAKRPRARLDPRRIAQLTDDLAENAYEVAISYRSPTGGTAACG